MKELLEILLGIAAFVGLLWVCLKSFDVYERVFGHPPESLWMRWLKRRNEPPTILGSNDKEVP